MRKFKELTTKEKRKAIMLMCLGLALIGALALWIFFKWFYIPPLCGYIVIP